MKYNVLIDTILEGNYVREGAIVEYPEEVGSLYAKVGLVEKHKDEQKEEAARSEPEGRIPRSTR